MPGRVISHLPGRAVSIQWFLHTRFFWRLQDRYSPIFNPSEKDAGPGLPTQPIETHCGRIGSNRRPHTALLATSLAAETPGQWRFAPPDLSRHQLGSRKKSGGASPLILSITVAGGSRSKKSTTVWT